LTLLLLVIILMRLSINMRVAEKGTKVYLEFVVDIARTPYSNWYVNLILISHCDILATFV
jgi:hypothetical protein